MGSAVIMPWLTPHRTIAITFGAFGVGLGLWAGASGALIDRAHVGAALYGVTLTALTLAYLLGMSAAATLARRLGLRRLVIAALLLAAPPLARLLTAFDAPALIGGLIVYGVFAGLIDAGMNAEATALERQLRRPIMARLHGVCSAGAALGAILGSAIVTGSEPWLAALLEACVFVAAAIALASVSFDGRERSPGQVEFGARVVSRSLVVIGLIVGVSIACETAALTWSAPLLRQEAANLAPLAGLGGAFFAACQAAVRLKADVLRARFDDRALIAISLSVAAMGFVIVAAPFGFTASIAGFAIVGFGTASIVPCGFALAGTRPGIPSAASISAVAFFGLFARAPAPLATGFIADAYSLSTAFLALAALLVGALGAVLILVPASIPLAGRTSR